MLEPPRFFRRNSLGLQRRKIRATTPAQGRLEALYGLEMALLLKLSKVGSSEARKTSMGILSVGVFLVTCFALRLFGETKSHPESSRNHAGGVLSNPSSAVSQSCPTPNYAEVILTVAVACSQRRRFKAVIVPWSCRSFRSKTCAPLTRALRSCFVGMPGDVCEPEKTHQGPHSCF